MDTTMEMVSLQQDHSQVIDTNGMPVAPEFLSGAAAELQGLDVATGTNIVAVSDRTISDDSMNVLHDEKISSIPQGHMNVIPENMDLITENINASDMMNEVADERDNMALPTAVFSADEFFTNQQENQPAILLNKSNLVPYSNFIHNLDNERFEQFPID